MKFIVTAGGQGKKLWPYSRSAFPKQFQPLIDGKSLLQINIEVLLKSYSTKDIFISTKRKYADIVYEQCPQLDKSNFIIEPDIAKNRGPAEGLAFLHLDMKYPDEPFMIVQADDLRIPDTEFINTIKIMENIVKKDKKYITGGIKTENPVMGNDLIEIGDRVEGISGNGDIEVYKITSFLGRSSDYYKTKEILLSKRAVLHCNHGCWYTGLMLDAYKKYRPDWYESLMKIKKCLEKGNSDREIEEIYSSMEKGPTEEVTKNILYDSYVVILPFKWVDIGTWTSYYEYFSKDGEVYSDGKLISINSKNCLIKVSDRNKLVVIQGLDDLMVIDSGDSLLIMPKKDSGKVNDIVDEIESKGLAQYT